MAIRSFSAFPSKGLRHAAYENLPNLVVIAGPNGSGKSTLLHQLSQNRVQFAEPGTRVIYVGPHRTWRKSVLTGANMYGLQYSFREALEMLTFPQFQTAPAGLQMLAYVSGHQRDPDTADKSYAVVKQTIAKTGFSRQRRVTRAYDDNGGMIPPNTIPDIFEPLRELTRFLLPHLQFETVDLDNEQNIRVLFHRADGDVRNSIDIDDLSSGEKAVISLFLPYVEDRMQRLLSGEPADSGAPLPTTLIDEPEIHLHPTLQVSMLEYMREMTERGEAQFILTTHSTTILDALSDDELFLLAPVASVGDGNQFLQVTASQERLEAIRQLTGSTHSVTRGRPIVFIEGVQPSAKCA